jgi:hypothetical protein
MRIHIVVVLALVLGSAAHAEERYSASHRAAAEELLVLSGAEKNAMVGASTMADAMLQGNPTLAPFRDIILAWSAKALNWQNMKPKMVELYVESFSESELREISAFYRTPVGAKSLEVLPTIMQRSMQMGVDLASEHQAELQRMIQERAAELQQQSN